MVEQAMAEAPASPENTVMIGDTAYDIEMARNAGVRAIGVAWGYHAPDELIAAGAAAVARDAAHLAELLQ
jgi:phosphoglycolate phosphatase